MSRLAIGWVVLLMATGPALADSSTPYRSNPTFYFLAPVYQSGVSDLVIHMGASGQRFWDSGLGWTGEIGYFTPKDKVFDGGQATLSAGLAYRVYSRDNKLAFLSAGYSTMGLGKFFHFGHVGGGLDVWGEGRWGIRLEARALLREMRDFSYLEFRIGFLN